MTLQKIANGTVYDPANGLDGEVRDLWIRDGKVVAASEASAPGSPEPRPNDEGLVPDIKKWFESYYTIQFANYPVDEHYLAHGGTRVECQK